MARCVWALVGDEITEHVSMSSGENCREFLSTMIESLSEVDQVKCFVTLWAIWYAKRKVIHEDIYQSLLSTFSNYYDSMEEEG
jgi:hypothetical protein